MFDQHQFNRLRCGVLLVSLLAWALILTKDECSCGCKAGAGVAGSWQELLESYPPGSLAQAWALMLVAMMAPMLVAPIYFIRATSFPRIRVWLVALFVAGYATVWMSAGVILTLAKVTAKQWLPGSYWPTLIAGLAVIIWQASPAKQSFLNRCHSHRSLAAFGWAAGRDAWRMGLEHGIWCVGSCWALMLFPMLLPAGHNAAMIAVALVMFCERLDLPAKPSWRLRGFRTAYLYVVHKLRGPRTTPMPYVQALQS